MNTEHQTLNLERRVDAWRDGFGVRCSMFDVRCFRSVPNRAASFARSARTALGHICLWLAWNALAADPDPISPLQPRFLGAQSCSSSSCHGGAGEKSNPYTLWSTHDFHHLRPYATLETARAERLAEVLKIGSPTQSPRCTVCHAPFQTLPAERLAPEAKISEGVSCETCHGPAGNWIRSHTRPDYTDADRVHAGMRGVKNLYVRANLCVACHQNLDHDIRAAGHPELIFELDGQSVTMPKHWSKTNDYPGSMIWLAGQEVALREMSWQLLQSPDPDLVERWAGLLWVLQRVHSEKSNLDAPAAKDYKRVQADYDRLARQLGDRPWHPGQKSSVNVTNLVGELANTSDAFVDKSVSTPIKARRAERLVLALDRLVSGPGKTAADSAVNQSLNRLFAGVQSLPDFDPDRFAKDLKAFQASVSALETKQARQGK